MPIPTITTTYKKLKGAANVEIHQDRVIVTFEDSGEPISFPRTDETVKVDVTNIQNGRMYAEASGNKQTLWGLRPLSGSFYVKFAGIAKAEGQVASPRRYEGTFTANDGTVQKYSYEAFIPLFEITRGSWEKTIFPGFLRYKFALTNDGQEMGLRTRGKHAELLAQFLECAGLDFDIDTLPVSENVLPWLETTLVDRGRQFMLVVENGYVAAFAPVPEGI